MTKRKRTVALLAALAIFGCSSATQENVGEVSVAELQRLLQANPSLVLVDVRTPEEWESVRAVGIKSFVEYDEIAERHGEIGVDFDTRIYLICRSGRRSGVAAKTLFDKGYKHLYNVAGGTNAWTAAGYSVESGPRDQTTGNSEYESD